MLCNNRKLDILRIDPVTRNIEIIEVTICYDLYFQLVQNGKIEKYTPLHTQMKIYSGVVSWHQFVCMNLFFWRIDFLNEV